MCFVVCFGQMLGLWLLKCLFSLSLKKVSIPETVLMYLRYYSKIAMRLSGNVKTEAVNLRICFGDYGFLSDIL